jgi:two-component system, sensor histidine kinase RegB
MLRNLSTKTQTSVRQNLRWLFILRNLIMLSEVLLIILAVYGLGIKLPEQQLWLVVMSTGAINIYTSMRLDTNDPVTELEIFSQISVDVFIIAALLYLTGGASNPITWVFLLPLIITSIMLPPTYAWYMVILTTSMYTMLIAFNVPLPSIEPHMPDPQGMATDLQHYIILQHAHSMHDKSYFSLHMFGMWFGFVFSAGLVAYFVAELAKTLRFQERNLAEARENALRDERVVALGTLAASAAHDMGTPLGTMAIVAHELEQDYPSHRYPDLYEKMIILQQQISRCKQALSVMSASAGEMRAESGGVLQISDYIDDVINQWRTHEQRVKLNYFIESTVDLDAKIIAERTLTHALINILNNAAEASPRESGIDFHASWDSDYVILKIRDYGPGFPSELIDVVGKQPVVSKTRGLGVGLFLTFATITRLGGKAELYNAESGGACVEITLPLLNFERENNEYGNG